jgi:hypothetical protein
MDFIIIVLAIGVPVFLICIGIAVWHFMGVTNVDHE